MELRKENFKLLGPRNSGHGWADYTFVDRSPNQACREFVLSVPEAGNPEPAYSGLLRSATPDLDFVHYVQAPAKLTHTLLSLLPSQR